MNEKVTMPALAAMLAERSGYSKKQCEDFLREFFITVADTLASGENVKVKGLGTFRVIKVAPRKSVDVNTGKDIEIPGHSKIVFAAAKELADVVNEPFSMFESVEIEDSYDDKSINDAVTPEDTSVSTQEFISQIPDSKDGEVDVREEVSAEPETEDVVTEKLEVIPAELESDSLVEEFVDNEMSQADEDIPVKSSRRRYGFLLGMGCGIMTAALLGIAVWFFYIRKYDSVTIYRDGTYSASMSDGKTANDKLGEIQNVETIVTDSVVDGVGKEEPEVKTEVDVPTFVSDEQVYDTISKTRYLTTMAKEHYGNYNLWPYIYEENKSILGHPDRIRPGTRVVVPSLSKYGVDPDNPEDIKIAKRKGMEIYSKFK